MKELNILAGNVINNFLSNIWLNTKGRYRKESNTLATDAITKQIQRGVWLNTNEQFM